MKRSILVVDDEKQIRDSLAGVLTDEGYEVTTVENAEKAAFIVRSASLDLILLDIWMPGMDGMDALKIFKREAPEVPVIMISGHGTVETAVKATKLGAYDFLEKPLSLEKVVLTIEHALEKRRLIEENEAFLNAEKAKFKIIGESEPIRSLINDIKKVGPTNSWVLITGENGTGKELVARNIHLFSTRTRRPFVALNCAAIPDDLIESELFGHEKGAFTGAIAKKKGCFDLADGGTLFLDEIADMSLKTQAKVLRILQEQNFERVGGTKKITVNVRVVAATNKNLEEEIKNGNFREDLYYRLNVIPFSIPPLRDRGSDISIFFDYYLEEFSRQTSTPIPVISEDAARILLNYRWPGNVRELKNLMERLVIMSSSNIVNVEDLPVSIRGSVSVGSGIYGTSIKEARRAFEKEFIAKKLSEFNGNISKTAEAIGLERSHLHRKIKSYGIPT
ncbi:MAG: sigma-54-dependent Fis family transcriptional regulator [Deltaproteobacteria bacterium]|nr:sigma-54-dependent Fis family transcriptional regulator [Deltaproteobacteria bacterium]